MAKTINVNGYKLEISPVSPLAPKSIEIQFKKKNPRPVKPTYSVEAAGGVVEIFPHTPETVETVEEKEAYLAWKDAEEEWQAQLSYKLMRLFLTSGVKLKLTAKQEEELEAQVAILGLDVPAIAAERELFYLETFIINSQESMQTVMQAVLEATGITQAAVETANELFPDRME